MKARTSTILFLVSFAYAFGTILTRTETRVFGESTVCTKPARIPLESVLGSICAQTGIHFTLEYDDSVSDASSALSKATAPLMTNASDMNQVVRFLSEELPDVSVERDRKFAQIVHLQDRSLDKHSDYVMRQRLTIRFQGVLDDLVTEIAAHVRQRLTSHGMFFLNDGGGDGITAVNLDAQDTEVRSLLSASIPMQHYWVILWQSHACVTKDGIFTVLVHHRGPDRGWTDDAKGELDRRWDGTQ